MRLKDSGYEMRLSDSRSTNFLMYCTIDLFERWNAGVGCKEHEFLYVPHDQYEKNYLSNE